MSMMVALDTPTQRAFNPPSRPRTAWLMLIGFFIYTLLILTGHVVGFPLGYAYLHTVCPSGCSLTPGNVHPLAQSGPSITFYPNLYLVIQVLYIMICVGLPVRFFATKHGRWVPW